MGWRLHSADPDSYARAVAQRTVVVKVPSARREALREKLGQGAFEWRQVPHADFSVKGEGVVATLYSSGKFVVQGSDPESFLVRFTDEEAPAPPRPIIQPKGPPPTETATGSDEAGKGDYFGPLVVAAVRLDPKLGLELQEMGIEDSKTLSDTRALRLAAFIRDRVEHHHIVSLSPRDYNERYPTFPSLNPLLADLHAEAIRAVAQPGELVIVDQFARGGVMKRALGDLDCRLDEKPRAEIEVCVAAASVLARGEFLLALADLSERYGIDLRKGAGAPTDEAGAAFLAEHGPDALTNVAKLHFKNTQKIQALAAGSNGGGQGVYGAGA
jgi:ribonuclease HIII